jgi:hypothetical protein
MSDDPEYDAMKHFHDQADFEQQLEDGVIDEFGELIFYGWMEE